jgi:hypothetical protein
MCCQHHRKTPKHQQSQRWRLQLSLQARQLAVLPLLQLLRQVPLLMLLQQQQSALTLLEHQVEWWRQALLQKQPLLEPGFELVLVSQLLLLLLLLQALLLLLLLLLWPQVWVSQMSVQK